ncbi:MAG: hypothetical protein JF597_26340, partial [Streptomyces sp.]|nr:hypothetical protein [Streptomyces sp.]
MPVDVPVPLLSDALDVATLGESEAGPLAESLVDGVSLGADDEGDGDGLAGWDSDFDGLGDGDFDGDGDLEGDADGECVVPPPDDPFVPVAEAEGVFVSEGGVGSSEVPRVPSGPGSVGLVVAVPASPVPEVCPGSASRLPSPVPSL